VLGLQVYLWYPVCVKDLMDALLYLACWLADVVALSSALALFEIVLERGQGWASGLSQRGLGKRLWEGSLFVRLLEKPYITVYHLLIFGLVVPLILLIECWVIRLWWARSPLPARGVPVLSVWAVGSVRFSPLLSAAAAWLAVSTLEDFLWFAFNWHYPGGLRRLLSGEVWWHTRWVSFRGAKLPRFYVTVPLIALALLWASTYLARIPTALARPRGGWPAIEPRIRQRGDP
jgi:hypothetical protein